MFLKDFLRKNKFVYKFYRKIIFPNFLNKEIDIKKIRNFSFNVAIDIGANVGTYTVELQKNSKKVYSFEPILRNVTYLSWLADKNVKIKKYALGSTNSKEFIYTPSEGKSSDFALSSLSNHLKYKINSRKQLVSVKKFDDILKNKKTLSKIDFVKIDVEGYEFNVLKGMSRLFLYSKPIFLIEIEKKHNPHYLKVLRFMLKRKYKIYFINELKNFERLSQNNFVKFVKLGKVNNFWFINDF